MKPGQYTVLVLLLTLLGLEVLRSQNVRSFFGNIIPNFTGSFSGNVNSGYGSNVTGTYQGPYGSAPTQKSQQGHPCPANQIWVSSLNRCMFLQG